MDPKYWLMKSEPNEFSTADLQRRPRQTEPWDGAGIAMMRVQRNRLRQAFEWPRCL